MSASGTPTARSSATSTWLLDEGELVVVSGRTGVGKSTLLGVVTGLVPRFTGGTLSGDVLIDGRSVVHEPPRERAHLVGYVGQDPAAGFVTDTVEEELAYGMEQLGLAPDTMRRRVEETLDLLGVADLRARDLRTLSGGEQQRVAIGSVLTMHPRVLVLDEPTSALDPTAAEEVLATLTRLVHDLGLSVLMAEHRLERVVPFADRMVLLTGDGTVRADEPAEILAVSPVVPPITELGRRLRLGPAAGDRARRTAAGPRARPRRAPAPAPQEYGAPVAVGEALTVVRGATVALKDASVRLRPGTRDRADGAQRVRQVDPAVDPPGQPRAQGRTRRGLRHRPRHAGAGPAPRPRRAGAADRRRPALPRDRRRGVRWRPTAARGRPASSSTGWCPTSPTTPIRATCPRVSGWPWPWSWCWSVPRPCCCSTSRPAGLDYPAKAELAPCSGCSPTTGMR